MAGGSHGIFITNQATTFKGFRICTVHHCTHMPAVPENGVSVDCTLPALPGPGER